MLYQASSICTKYIITRDIICNVLFLLIYIKERKEEVETKYNLNTDS